MKIQRALLSVSDKSGLADFARGLAAAGVELISTGGTASALREAGLTVKDVSEHTGFPEMLDGRVKTLHPLVHGGILHQRDNQTHLRQCAEHNIRPIDIVAVNLYAFADTVARPGCTLADAIENIDIGGPTLLRAAAKNCRDVSVIVDPADYDQVLAELSEHGNTRLTTRFRLARKVFALTAAYDAAISRYLETIDPATEVSLAEAGRDA